MFVKILIFSLYLSHSLTFSCYEYPGYPKLAGETKIDENWRIDDPILSGEKRETLHSFVGHESASSVRIYNPPIKAEKLQLKSNFSLAAVPVISQALLEKNVELTTTEIDRCYTVRRDLREEKLETLDFSHLVMRALGLFGFLGVSFAALVAMDKITRPIVVKQTEQVR